MKHYELHKSNESSSVAIIRELRRIRSISIDNQISIVSSIVEVAISTIVAIETSSIDFVSNLGTCKRLFLLVGSFLASFIIMALAIKLIWALIKWLNGRKSTLSKQKDLRDYFYQTILNHIVTGISLKEKSEIAKADMKSLFLFESLYYLNLSYEEMTIDKLFFQDSFSIKKQQQFLRIMNVEFLLDLFNKCISTLSFIKQANSWDKETLTALETLITGYKTTIARIINDSKIPADFIH